MNPCACGKLGDPRNDCRCTDPQRRAYRARLSGPLLDRFDLQVEVPALAFEEISGAGRGESSAAVRERVIAAREIQSLRFAGRTEARVNARMSSTDLETFCAVDRKGCRLLKQAMRGFGLSARAHDRILKMARTIADLAGSDAIRSAHVAEAVQYRCLDRGE